MVIILEHPFATINVISLIFIAAAFVMTLKLKKLMGRGRDTKAIQLLEIVIILISLMGFLQLAGGYLKYLQDFWKYIQLTDIVLLVSGAILFVSVYRVYTDYAQLIKKHEPSN